MSEPTRDVCEGGVGSKSDALADEGSIPSPSPPTSVRWVLNVSDVNCSDSRAEMTDDRLDEEKSENETGISLRRKSEQ